MIDQDPHLTVAGTIEDATASPRYSQSWAVLVPGNHRMLMASNSLAKARVVFKFGGLCNARVVGVTGPSPQL
jgi:hypothetical protein